jgi:hypothetical protein
MMQKPDRKVGVGAGLGGLTTVIVGLIAAFTDVEIQAVTAVGFTSFMTLVVQYFVPDLK